MGSTEDDGDSGKRWWENAKLTPTDLRLHSESWSLAADAATATLLQSISQRLVSRTHDVEGALKKVLEDTDRVMTAISNTNNAFNMLANTQFIENRTYQDDADVVREKSEVVEKPPTTEEDVITRCRNAITEGLDLVKRCYERHEIQDSDSEDEDSPGSPVPIYALIDPYESKPLPLIIGSEGFMADDKVGLQEVSSSEENSKMTFSPEETESEDEADLEDEGDHVAQKFKAIPASSSKVMDDESSDSDWSDEEVNHPVGITAAVNKHARPPQVTSEEEEDEEEDLFGPSSRTPQRLSNSGPGLPSHIGKKTSITADTASIRSKGGLDSDSDENEDLFGRKREPSFTSGKQNSSTQPPPSKREKTRDLFANTNSQTPPASTKSSIGVENVRAMPDPTRPGIPSTGRPQNNSSNLFASDTDDDEGDLFSNKPVSSAKTKSQISKVKSQPPEQSTTAASGLFSSDEDGGLFSTPTVKTQGVVNSGEDNSQKEEPPPLPKPAGKKVPVGGINIFGSAITSAIHKQHSSESEPSHDERSNRGSSRSSSSVSLNKPDPPPAQQTAAPKTANAGKYSVVGGGGLFDDDEEEDLFGSIVKKPATSSSETKSCQKEPILPVLSDSIKKPDREGANVGDKAAADTVSNKNVIKSTGGLFSDDDDDDLFGIPARVEKRPSTLPIPPPTPASTSTKKPSETNSVVSNAKDDGQFDSGPAVNSAISRGVQKSSEPVKVPDPPKTLSNSLFSSPSDDDDLFSPSSTFHSAKSTPAFITEPPPLPPASTSKPSYGISESPTSQANEEGTSTSQISNNKSVEVNAEQKAKGTPFSNRFSSPSDDDDLFSSPSSTVHEDATATQESKGRVESINAVKSENVAPDITSNVSSQRSESEHRIPVSPDEDLFTPKTRAKVDLTIEGAKPSLSSKSEMPTEKVNILTSSDDSVDDMFSDTVSKTLLSKKTALKSDKKDSSLLGVSDDEDIFATTQKEAKPKLFEKVKDDEDIFSTSVTQSQHQKGSVYGKVTESDSLAKIASETSVRDRESPPILPSGAESPPILPSGAESPPILPSGAESPPILPSGAESPPVLPSEAESPPILPSEAESPPTILAEGASSNAAQASESELAPTSEPEKPAEVVKKRPVGGVALFGGAELAAQVSKRKSMLSPAKTKDGEVQEERSKPTPPVVTEENVDTISESNIFDGDDDDDDDFFGISRVNSERSHSLSSRRSPPPLPTEVKKTPSASPQEPKSLSSHIQEGPRHADTKLQGDEICPSGESDLLLDKKSKTKDLNESAREKKDTNTDKTEKIATLEKESRGTKPLKKPPVGGVSLFGGGLFGGSELLAKVQQRKSMLTPDSDSDDDDDGPSSNIPTTSPTKEENTALPARKNVTPVSPISPVSPLSPVFGPEPLVHKSGGQEKSVSFDEPTNTSTTLQSLNKSRARGSIKRRPPSRAHRRGDLGENDPSVMPNNLTGMESAAPRLAVSSSSVKQTSPSPTVASQPERGVSPKRQKLPEADKDKGVAVDASSALVNDPSKVDSMFVDDNTEDDIFGNSTITKVTNIVENKDKSAEISVKEESKYVALKDKNEDVGNDLFGNSVSALSSSKSSSKGSSKALFGGNDSDDEDLFGQTKPNTSLLKTSRSNAVQNSVTKSVTKPSPTQSLFEDDDDDIFNPRSSVEKDSRSAPRKVSTSKPKSNLKPSSEPFEDPLLGCTTSEKSRLAKLYHSRSMRESTVSSENFSLQRSPSVPATDGSAALSCRSLQKINPGVTEGPFQKEVLG